MVVRFLGRVTTAKLVVTRQASVLTCKFEQFVFLRRPELTANTRTTKREIRIEHRRAFSSDDVAQTRQVDLLLSFFLRWIVFTLDVDRFLNGGH